MPTRPDRAEVPFYPDDLLPQLQQTLALLADLETRYEIERDHLESWSGPKEIKDHLLAELDQCHRANRERLAACLEGAHLEGRIVAGPPENGSPREDVTGPQGDEIMNSGEIGLALAAQGRD